MQSLPPGIRPDLESTSKPQSVPEANLLSWNGTSAAALGNVCDNAEFRQFFRQYPVADIMRGYELAQDTDLFTMARKYRSVDLRLLLRFQEDDALEFFEQIRRFRGSDILQYREVILRASRGSRDSGYASRPSSEIEGSMDLSLAYGTATPTAPQQSSLSTHHTLPKHILRVADAFPSTPQSKAPVESDSIEEHTNLISHSPPQWPRVEWVASSPLDMAKSSQPRRFECMYCAQDFVRYGDCLNHERDNHSQRKEWVCPHCNVQSKTKAGHDRHHRNHGCHQCTAPERVVILSGPKIAAACYYCGVLFEGTDCFAMRADHIKTTHYKGELRKTRADLDFSRMIKSLVSQTRLDSAWVTFMQRKPNVDLNWTAENARELVDVLELEEHITGHPNLIQWIYDLASKTELPRAHASTKMNYLTQIGHQNGHQNGINHKEGAHDPDRFGSATISGLHSRSTLDRTRSILSSPLPGEGRASPRLRADVFMGSRRTPDDSDAMEICQPSRSMNLAPTPRNPTPPSGSCAFWEIDDSLLRMEDLMTQHYLESSLSSLPQQVSQPLNAASSYTPPGWENNLPPSIQLATNASPLPWPPHYRSTRE